MNVLVVDEEVPFPLNTGKRIRTYNLIKRLQERHRVTFICYGTPDQKLEDCPNLRLVLKKSPILEQKGARFYRSLLENLFSSNPYIVDRHFSQSMSRDVIALADAEPFDLVHCEWTPYAENIRALLPRIPSVLSAHNVEAQIWARYYATEQNPVKRAYIGHQWHKLAAFEKEASRLFTSVATVSEPDRDFFVGEYGCRSVTVVPNGVDVDYFAPQQVAQDPYNMVFTGSMDWRPNQDGVRFFIEKVFPLIRREIPAASFTVVGRKPPVWLRELASRYPGVVITGTVDDVRPYVARAALYVVPLRVGGGSRLKILEALAMEKIVLSTTVGAEGLDVRDGKDVLLRDTPEELAISAVRVLQMPEPFRPLARAGRALIFERYTWDAIADVMESVWLQAVGGGRG
jgi:polysaccharide biosynthesis protein PslH